MALEWRHPVDDEAQSSDAATYTWDLPEQGNLHALLLKVQCTNGATGGRAASMLDVLDNVLIQGPGTNILYELIPEVAEKLYETLYGRALTMVQTEVASAVQEIVIPILFGRELYDPDFYLPLDAVKVAQLRAAFSPSIAADGGFATGTTTFDIMALMSAPGDVGSYRGTMVTREIRNFTSAASGDEATEISTRAALRLLGAYVYEAGVADGTNVTRIRYTENDRSRTPFDAGWDDFIHLNREMFGCDIEHMARLLLANDEAFISRIGEVLGYNVEVNEAGNAATDVFNVVAVDGIAGDTLTFDSLTATIAAGAEVLAANSSDADILCQVRGKSPSYFGLIPFLAGEKSGEYYSLSGKQKAEVILTQGNAGADVRLIQQTVERLY